MPHDHHQRMLTTRNGDRRTLLVRQPSTVGGELLVKAPRLTCRGVLWDLLKPGGGEALGDRYDCSLIPAVVFGGAAPVHQQQNLAACPERSELVQGREDRGAGRLLQGCGSCLTGGERGIELGERHQYLPRAGFLKHCFGCVAQHFESFAADPVSDRFTLPFAVEVLGVAGTFALRVSVPISRSCLGGS
jgi:hypothetical protein